MERRERSLVDRRRFTFGRRDADRRRMLELLPDTKALRVVEKRDEARKIADEVAVMIRTMPSSKEYFEGLLAQLQRDGYVILPREEETPKPQSI